MTKEPFIFDLANKTAAVTTRNQITTTIPNTGALKTPTGENYSVQVATMLPYRATKLRYAVTLGIAGTNSYFRYAWGPQDSEDPAYIVVVIDTAEDLLTRNESSLLETAQKHHAMLFEGHENTAALLNAIETLTKRATAVLAKQLVYHKTGNTLHKFVERRLIKLSSVTKLL